MRSPTTYSGASCSKAIRRASPAESGAEIGHQPLHQDANAGRPRRHAGPWSGHSSAPPGPGHGRYPRSRYPAGWAPAGPAAGRSTCAARRGDGSLVGHQAASSRRPLTVRVAARTSRSARSGRRGANRLAMMTPGREPTRRDSSTVDVDAATHQMTQSRHQGQRHGMGDVGAGDLDHRQLGIKQDQGRDAQRARADRGDRHQHAQRERRSGP